jgi:hypothetical protein
MSAKAKSEFYFGAILEGSTLDVLKRELRFAAETDGDFEHSYRDGCTVFIAPRNLGEAKSGRCKYLLRGYLLGSIG